MQVLARMYTVLKKKKKSAFLFYHMCSAIYPTFSFPSRALRLPPQRVQYGELAAVGSVQEVASLKLASSSRGVAVAAVRAVGHPGGAAAAPGVLFSREKKHKKFSAVVGGNLGKFVSRSRKVSEEKKFSFFCFFSYVAEILLEEEGDPGAAHGNAEDQGALEYTPAHCKFPFEFENYYFSHLDDVEGPGDVYQRLPFQECQHEEEPPDSEDQQELDVQVEAGREKRFVKFE